MNWNLFKMKTSLLCTLKGISMGELEKLKFKDVIESLKKYNLL